MEELLEELEGSEMETKDEALSIESFIAEDKKEAFNSFLENKLGTNDFNFVVSNISRVEELENALNEATNSKVEYHPLLGEFNSIVKGLDAETAKAKIHNALRLSSFDKLEGEELAKNYLAYKHPDLTKKEVDLLFTQNVYGGKVAGEDDEQLKVANKVALKEFNKTASKEIQELKTKLNEVTVPANVATQESEIQLAKTMTKFSSALTRPQIKIGDVSFEIDSKQHQNAVAKYLVGLAKSQPDLFSKGNIEALKGAVAEYQELVFFADKNNRQSFIESVKRTVKSTKTETALEKTSSSKRVLTQADFRKAFIK